VANVQQMMTAMAAIFAANILASSYRPSSLLSVDQLRRGDGSKESTEKEGERRERTVWTRYLWDKKHPSFKEISAKFDMKRRNFILKFLKLRDGCWQSFICSLISRCVKCELNKMREWHKKHAFVKEARFARTYVKYKSRKNSFCLKGERE